MDGDVSTGSKVAVTIAVSWLGWYTWKFLIFPLVYRDASRELPHFIPFLGHVILMTTGAQRMFLSGRKQFGDDPWAVTIMGESLYVIPSAEHVQAVYRAPKTLDFDPFIKEMLGKYGITSETASKMFDTLPRPGRMVLQDGAKERVASLFTWSEMVIVDVQTRAFFDDILYEECPDLLTHFQIYENEAWKIPMNLPDFATKALRSSKMNIEKGLRQYMNTPSHKKPNDSWIIKTLCEDMNRLGLEQDQKVYVLFSFYRVINATAYKLVFWAISYLPFRPDLSEEIKREIAPAFRNGNSSTPDIDFLLNSCPLLVSTCEEVLRLTIWSIGTRTAQAETMIGGRKLLQGKKLLVPYRAMHSDTAVFGQDALDFNPRRFMMKKGLEKDKSYSPFGGAVHYCPGRDIARREAQMCTAMMLMRFETSIVPSGRSGEKSWFPKMDDTLPSGGIQLPLNREDLIVRVKPRGSM